MSQPKSYTAEQKQALQELEGHLLQFSQQEAAIIQQLRAVRARRNSVMFITAAMKRLLGLDPAKIYTWEPGRSKDRFLPVAHGPEELPRLVQESIAPETVPADAIPLPEVAPAPVN